MNIVDKARNAVTTAIRKGKLPRLTGSLVRCVDCEEFAECYDHRDYAKPLEVEPVCHKCNLKRDKAENWVESSRLMIRLIGYEKVLVKMAADLEGRTLSSFVRHATKSRAKEVIEQHNDCVTKLVGGTNGYYERER